MTAALADTLQPVELADGVTIQLRVAGPAVRSLAWLIDLMVSIVCYLAAGIGLAAFGQLGGENVGMGLLLLFIFFFNWFYNVFFEMTRHSATPGQRMMGVKVSSVSGAPVRLPQSLIRNLLRVVDALPACYLFGLICCLFNSRFQRLGDLVADTVVVYSDPKPTPQQAFTFNLEAMPPPHPLNRSEQAAILQFMERSPQWSDSRRAEVAELLHPLTGSTGMNGLRRLCAIGLWLQNRGGKRRPT